MSADRDLTIVVERQAEAVLVDRLLEVSRGLAPRFFVSEGEMGLATLGRNLLLHEGGPVLVVMNAKTSDRELAAEQREFMATALRYIANDEAFEALAFMPQIDIMLFETPAVVEKLLAGRESTDLLLALGLHDPSSTLKRLLGHSDLTEYYRSLSADDVRKLSMGPQASELLTAVDRLVGSAAASRAA